MQPLVSVRCLVFNQEKYIRQCLDGIVSQKTDFYFEAIVHDDASTDGTADIIREYAQKYPDIIKPIIEIENQYSKHDGSILRIMNEACRGKYIAYCEGDDYWTDPLKLQKQVDVLEANPDVMMVYTGFQTVDEEGNMLYRYDFDYNMRISKSGCVFDRFLYRNPVMTVSSIFRREVFFSKYKTESTNGVDYLAFMCAAVMGKVVYLSEKTCCYRKHAASTTNMNGEKIRKKVINALSYFTEMYLSEKIEMDNICHYKVRIGIMAKGIDLWLKKQDKGYIYNSLKLSPSLWFYLIPGVMQECYYLFSYYSHKIFCRKNE
ncbi:MAG: glycosyltransferase [Tannerella sp.]|nr:glycosyltransferase [Tannerella sp.]